MSRTSYVGCWYRTVHSDENGKCATRCSEVRQTGDRTRRNRLCWDFASAHQIISRLTSPGQQALEGLSVELPWLGIGVHMDDEGGWKMLKTAVRQLECLTQLAVNTCRHSIIRDGSWNPGCYVDFRFLAKQLAVTAPQLRYINIKCGYWKVCPQANGERILEKLEPHEITRVELFHGHNASGRSTLPYNTAGSRR